jgi:molybdopterin converting factor small subunit
MKTIRIKLYGSLEKSAKALLDADERLGLTGPAPVREVIRRLDPSDRQVQMAMVNHRAVSWDVPVSPGDRLALFPREYPLFPDPKDFRSDSESAPGEP